MRRFLNLACALTLPLAIVACGGDGTSGNGGDGDGGPGDGDGGGGGNGDGGAGSDADCPSVILALQPVTPTVLLLIDRSGSMTTNFGGGLDRWEGTRKALTDPTTGVVTQLESVVRFGVAMYDGNGNTCPNLVPPLAPGFDQRDAIDQLFVDYQPAGDTPTGESITATLAFLDGLPPPIDGGEEGPRYIVLATDGEPDTCAVPNPQTGQPQAVAAAQAAFAADVPLFVLSVGGEVSTGHQEDMANAGAGQPLDTGTAPYFNGANPADLAEKFRTIINGVRECTLTLDGSITAEQAAQGNVVYNSMSLGMGTDWELVDSMTIRLLGDTCDAFLADTQPVLTAEFPCGTIID